ncbi:MAG: hypothetical protein ABI876_08375 [Bacteroidota bacterium]
MSTSTPVRRVVALSDSDISLPSDTGIDAIYSSVQPTAAPPSWIEQHWELVLGGTLAAGILLYFILRRNTRS